VADVISDYGIKVNAQPTICFYNGEPLLRKDWEIVRLSDADQLAFLSLPQGGGGGGGSNPTRVVLSIAIMAAAVYTGGLAGAAWGKVAGAIVSGTVAVAGSMLVNALIPAPKTSLQGNSNYNSPSPTYTLGSKGNQARLSEPIPVLYGRHLIYPDLAASPYTEYSNNEQYLYQLFCIGQGFYDIEKIRIEDSPIASFKEVYLSNYPA
jgi:sulfur carrier protein ThiS